MKKTLFIQGKIVPLGVAGVDSGQILICDPSYVGADSQWKEKDFKDLRAYQNVKTKEILTYQKDFPNFGTVIPKYDKDMNTLLKEMVFVEYESEEPLDNSFSYNGCCQQTLKTEAGGGQLVFEMGHEGAGVVSRTRHGDGTYEVFAVKDKDGNTKQLIVDFGYEEDKDCIINQLEGESPVSEMKDTLHKIVKHLEKMEDAKSKSLKGELLEKMLEIL